MALLGLGGLGVLVALIVFFLPPDVAFPNTPLPSPNGFDYALRATQAQQTDLAALDKVLQIKPKDTYDERQKIYVSHPQELQKWLSQNQAALQLLRQGLACEYREPPVRGVATVSPHYTGFRELGRTLTIESYVREAKGDKPGAARSALDGLKFGHQIPHGTPIIGALVGYAVQGVARRRLEQLLPHLDAKTCLMAAGEMESLHEKRVPFAEVLQEEKWNVASNLLTMLQGASGIGIQVAGTDTKTKKARFRPASKRRVMNDFLVYMDALSADAKKPYALSQPTPPPGDFMTNILVPVFLRGRWNTSKCETANQMLMTALALRAYQLKNGVYPATLSQLAPQFIKTVPPDGFGAGEPLRYKKQDANYRLWSIGSDKKDDGGQPCDNGKKTGRYLMQDKSQGDFVFGISR